MALTLIALAWKDLGPRLRWVPGTWSPRPLVRMLLIGLPIGHAETIAGTRAVGCAEWGAGMGGGSVAYATRACPGVAPGLTPAPRPANLPGRMLAEIARRVSDALSRLFGRPDRRRRAAPALRLPAWAEVGGRRHAHIRRVAALVEEWAEEQRVAVARHWLVA